MRATGQSPCQGSSHAPGCRLAPNVQVVQVKLLYATINSLFILINCDTSEASNLKLLGHGTPLIPMLPCSSRPRVPPQWETRCNAASLQTTHARMKQRMTQDQGSRGLRRVHMYRNKALVVQGRP